MIIFDPLSNNQVYYLLNKWVSSGIVEKKAEEKILPGGIQFNFKLSANGRNLLRELSSEIFSKIKTTIKEKKHPLDNNEILRKFTNIIKTEIREGLQEKLESFEKAQIEALTKDISDSIDNRLDKELDQYKIYL